MSESNSRSVLISRRAMLRTSVTLSVGVAAVALVGVACRGAAKELSCNDTVGLPPVDIQTRKALEYIDKSSDPQKVCSGCAQYVAGPASASPTCAGCKMFKGPVNPGGYCKVWAAKGAAPAASSG